MNPLRYLEKRIRGWLPKELSLPPTQRNRMVNHFMRLQLLRLAYGVVLGALLFTPFGVYHSRVEPYITGYLWGYNLPIGYAGLLLGIVAVLYPRLNALRRLSFSSFMPFIGLFLLLSFFFSPKDYFINLIHSTNFSSVQIDVDFAVGNSAVLALSLLSIAFGLVSFIRGWLPKEPNVPMVPAKIGFRVNERPLMTKQMGKGTSSTRFLRFPSIFLAVLGSLFIIQFNVQSHISLTSQVTWIIAGLTVGSIISASFAKWQLNRLTRDKELRATIAGSLFIAGIMLIFTGILVGVITNFPTGIRMGFMSSVFAGASVFGGVRYVLFLRWEKKNKMRILQNRSRFFVVPQSSTNNSSYNVELSEKSAPNNLAAE